MKITTAQFFFTLQQINNSPVVKKSNSCELYFEEDDLEPVVSKLKKHGIEFIHEIVEQPWKQRVMRFYDYDKNVIEIGERLEHLAFRLSKDYSIDEISKITYLSKESVRKAINDYSV